MATFDSKMVNEAYKQGARYVTITVHVAPALGAVVAYPYQRSRPADAPGLLGGRHGL